MEMYRVRKAMPEDCGIVVRLLEERVRWMEEKGIRQWTVSGYLKVFPESYFQEKARLGCLYILLLENGDPAGVIVFSQTDENWENDGLALYAHNLIVSTSAPGGGERLLRFGEKLASEMGKRFVRLDCVPHNEKLNAYYEKQGYMLVGTIDEPGYKGNKRQKII